MSESSHTHRRTARRDRRAGSDRLRAVLRQGDPDRGDPNPTQAERAAMRRLIVAAARSSSMPAWRPFPAIAAAFTAVALLATAALFWFGPAINDSRPRVADRAVVERPAMDRVTPDGTTTGGGATAGGDPMTGDGPATGVAIPDRPSVRNVQFVTAGGTRIVWVLNRNLDI